MYNKKAVEKSLDLMTTPILYMTNCYKTIQHNTIQYNTIQYNTIQYNTIKIQYNTIQYNTIQYNNTYIHKDVNTNAKQNESDQIYIMI